MKIALLSGDSSIPNHKFILPYSVKKMFQFINYSFYYRNFFTNRTKTIKETYCFFFLVTFKISSRCNKFMFTYNHFSYMSLAIFN